jgi:methylenetetrahydrofolate dehydrogenase (NADP+) / methenyltetrahydrofolate cyclohydrolase
MATLLDGKTLAERVRAEVKEDVSAFGAIGLATVLVGEDAASQIYIRRKHEAAEEVGIQATDIRLPEDTTQEELLARIAELNGDSSVHGLLVQLPLPDHLDEAAIIRAVDPAKDVDGLHPLNAGQLYLGRPTLVPATPVGIMALLAEYDIELTGARAVVVGRSDIVGKPVAHLLLHQHATVTICHSRTRDLERETLDADVLVVAVGHSALVTADMVKGGATVVDVGMNRTEAGLTGDVDPAAMDVAGHMTPVPGGVGPMTIASLLANTVRAASLQRGAFEFPAT